MRLCLRQRYRNWPTSEKVPSALFVTFVNVPHALSKLIQLELESLRVKINRTIWRGSMKLAEKSFLSLSTVATWVILIGAVWSVGDVCAIARAEDIEQPKIEDDCLTYDDRYSVAPLFKVESLSPADKIYLYSKKVDCARDGGDCPTSRKKAYLFKGDIVFAGPEDNGFRCIYYGNNKGKLTAGFIPVKRLLPYSEKEELGQEFLLGKWTNENNPKISIKSGGPGKVIAEGHAYWGSGDNVHTGDFESAPTSFSGKEVVFRGGEDSDDCAVTMRRRGPYMVVRDNSKCGGMNVRFWGILMKLK
jgi:hypothetical protein